MKSRFLDSTNIGVYEKNSSLVHIFPELSPPPSGGQIVHWFRIFSIPMLQLYYWSICVHENWENENILAEYSIKRN